MKKSQITTILIFVFIILIAIILYFVGSKKTVLAPVDDIIDANMPPIQNKDGILGNKDDLISFSIKPWQKVSGQMRITGVLKGAYFFEGNLPITILDENKNKTSFGPGHANATTDWMTAGSVSFAFDIDFSTMPNSSAYIRISEDDPRDAEERGDDPIKEILIPIIIQ